MTGAESYFILMLKMTGKDEWLSYADEYVSLDLCENAKHGFIIYGSIPNFVDGESITWGICNGTELLEYKDMFLGVFEQWADENPNVGAAYAMMKTGKIW